LPAYRNPFHQRKILPFVLFDDQSEKWYSGELSPVVESSCHEQNVTARENLLAVPFKPDGNGTIRLRCESV
jgi:hypothetical protein